MIIMITTKENNNLQYYVKVTLLEFKKLLQCAPQEPTMDQNSGIMALMKLVPLSRKGLEVTCAWLESSCSDWKQCNQLINSTFSKGALLLLLLILLL